jgi:integrase
MVFALKEWVLKVATRNKPLFRTDVGVKIYGPTTQTGKGQYYRIVYAIDGAQRERSATTLDKAKQRAVLASKEVLRGGERRVELSINEYLDAYLDPKTREHVGRSWGDKHTTNTTNLFKLYIRKPFGMLECSEINNSLLRTIIKQAGTRANGDRIRRSLSTWIFESREILLSGLSNEVRKLKGSAIVLESGENHLYVDKKDIPTHADVAAVAAAAAQVSGIAWYELMFNLAAYSGLRIGEIIDLDVTSIDILAKTIRVSHQCLEVAGKKSRELPKFGKKRTTTFPTITPSGYPLQKQLESRIAEVNAIEESADLKDGSYRRLLFTNTKGGWICQSSFGRSVRRPAQEIAGWSKKADGDFLWTFHSLRHVFCSFYLSDLKQSASNVAVAAGHSNVHT